LNSVAGSPDGSRVVATSIATLDVGGAEAESGTGVMTPSGCPQLARKRRRRGILRFNMPAFQLLPREDGHLKPGG